MDIVKVKSLNKRYDEIVAADGISFEVHPGECFGIVGPNGAGKTTTIEMVAGLRVPDSGSVEVFDWNWATGAKRIREAMGVQLQQTSLPRDIKVREVLKLFSTFYIKSLPLDFLWETFALRDKKNAYVENLSRGQSQRLAMALAFINDPDLLILDEPTLSLDPQGRLRIWEIIAGVKQQGKTIMLTTNNIEEAEKLCHRVAIINNGRIVALDTPKALASRLGGRVSLEQAFIELTGRRISD